MTASDLQSGLAIKVDSMALRGVVCALPTQVVKNQTLAAQFGEKEVNDVIKMIGVHERRLAPPHQTAADLSQAAADRLLDELGWARDTVDALIFVTQTPDYTLPASACALQARLGLKRSCAAFDVNLGCSGYVYGLWLAGKLLDGRAIKRVLLLAGETPSKITDPSDRSTAMLFGDGGSASAIEFDAGAAPAHFVLGSDGAGERHLMIPSGRYKPYLGDDARLEGRDPTCLFMDGGEIFNFTLSNIPQLVSDTLETAGKTREQVDAFLFHQANTFMLKHIIKKAKLAPERAPINMDRYGNTSCVSIPLLLVDKCPQVQSAPQTVAMFGFGVGYSWSGAVLDLPVLAVNRLIEV
ncbi:3-oxoacyl-ACP synthase III family protein [Duganella qianjiadongensis]|uniref:Ketoacyl-ACP synthase III n=1 Tax=Duganella qianjiadongensis TaxID=2692176 RepID=A0ABW9VRU0_9BURK|nr:ketoacyl-ACP synthase III [Duganella qianjiadongensis]MYM41228.1 ketoacyl-ACP synthase III [Duganella qianjiadongensis]